MVSERSERHHRLTLSRKPIPGVAPLRGLTPGSLEKSLEKSPKIAGIIRQIHVYLF